ncbi:MAG: hypothetical protein AAGH38_08280, partial [Pseudomonadota bacterium]
KEAVTLSLNLWRSEFEGSHSGEPGALNDFMVRVHSLVRQETQAADDVAVALIVAQLAAFPIGLKYPEELRHLSQRIYITRRATEKVDVADLDRELLLCIIDSFEAYSTGSAPEIEEHRFQGRALENPCLESLYIGFIDYVIRDPAAKPI